MILLQEKYFPMDFTFFHSTPFFHLKVVTSHQGQIHGDKYSHQAPLPTLSLSAPDHSLIPSASPSFLHGDKVVVHAPPQNSSVQRGKQAQPEDQQSSNLLEISDQCDSSSLQVSPTIVFVNDVQLPISICKHKHLFTNILISVPFMIMQFHLLTLVIGIP